MCSAGSPRSGHDRPTGARPPVPDGLVFTCLWDRDIQYRIDRHWELRDFTGIPLAAAVNDEAEIQECVAKLRAGPILS